MLISDEAIMAGERLTKQLDRCKHEGTVDMSCHVEVTSTTELGDTVAVITNLLEREERGELGPKIPLSSLRDFGDLIAHFRT